MKLWKGKVAGMATVLKCLSGKNKGKINKSSYPPNHLKRYVIRNPDIPNSNTSESEHGSDNENEAKDASSTNDETADSCSYTSRL